MNIVILYDSRFGNTKKVAEAIAGTFGKPDKVRLLEVGKAKHADVTKPDLLIVGSPTHGGRPTQALQTFLDFIPLHSLNRVKVASFDTRFEAKDVNLFLKLLMGVIGFAAPKIANLLVSKGGNLIIPPAGFIVMGKEGPLKDGELLRAASWAISIHTAMV